MKKILQLLSLLLILTVSISCEEDSADYLSGTEWRCGESDDRWSWSYVIKFDETTFEVVYSECIDGVEEVEVAGVGTYTCSHSSVILVVGDKIYDRGVIVYDQMVFNTDDYFRWEFKKL